MVAIKLLSWQQFLVFFAFKDYTSLTPRDTKTSISIVRANVLSDVKMYISMKTLLRK